MTRNNLIIASLCVLAPASAIAQGAPEEDASAHYARAVELYNQGRNREALDEFDKAIAAVPSPVYFCNRGIVLLKLEENQRAIEDLRACRDTYEDLDDDGRAKIDAQIKALETFEFIFSPNARQAARDIARGPEKPIVIERPVVIPPPDNSPALRGIGWSMLGLGLASLGGAAGLDVASRPMLEDFQDSRYDADSSRHQELQLTLAKRQTAFYALSITGGALALAGVTTLIVDKVRRDRAANSSVTITPEVSKESTSLQLRLRF